MQDDLKKLSLEEVSKALADTYIEAQRLKSDPRIYPALTPSTSRVIHATKKFLEVLIPRRLNEDSFTDHHHISASESLSSFLSKKFEATLKDALEIVLVEVRKVLPEEDAAAVLEQFVLTLPAIRLKVIEDIQAAYQGDPAAASFEEILLSYPSILCVSAHRIAHELHIKKVPLIPRIISEWAHAKTGIDIHPGARIASGFFIDHGTGVVIGETTIIGKNVKVYQGVTLGARSFSADENGNLIRGEKRHPTVEDNVVIYANSTILGGKTVIGAGSIIGGNVFLIESVPPGSKILGDYNGRGRSATSTSQ